MSAQRQPLFIFNQKQQTADQLAPSLKHYLITEPYASRTLQIRFRDGRRVAGELLAYDAHELVIREKGQVLQVTADQIESIWAD